MRNSMSHAPHDNRDESNTGFQVDTLATGIVFVLTITVLQKMLGLVRSILFCRFLDDDELGVWSLAFSFLLLAAPLAVLGLPGSFGRYVEYYRQRGQLRQFLRRTTFVSSVLAVVAVACVLFGSEWLSLAIFNDANQVRLVTLLGVSLIAVIAFNFVAELLTAMRQARAVALVQLVNNVVFAVVGLGLICFAEMGAAGVVIGYAAGSGLACVVGLCIVSRCWRSLPAPHDQLPQRDLWAKLVPFAAWVWVVNLLTNLFDAADRYMIVHFAAADAASAQALVGQYHSSRVIPVLMIALAGMLAGVILPYLSSDWEAGRRETVSRRVNFSVKLIALAFTAGGVLVLLGSRTVFDWVLAGKYNDGLAVLPWSLTYCIWFSLGIVAQGYLWCAEKARLASLALLVGLLANIGLNFWLLPVMGLTGAAVATAAANAITLVLIYLLSRWVGMRVDRGTWLASVLPLALCLGAAPSGMIMLSVALLAWRTNWFFQPAEKDQLAQLAFRYFDNTKRLARFGKVAAVAKG